jgi:hypothetical protein
MYCLTQALAMLCPKQTVENNHFLNNQKPFFMAISKNEMGKIGKLAESQGYTHNSTNSGMSKGSSSIKLTESGKSLYMNNVKVTDYGQAKKRLS